jgi:hypothetical protein
MNKASTKANRRPSHLCCQIFYSRNPKMPAAQDKLAGRLQAAIATPSALGPEAVKLSAVLSTCYWPMCLLFI